MNETTGDYLALDKDSATHEGTDNKEILSPLLPRSGWQNRRAFLSVLIRTKRSLDIEEIVSFLD